MRVNVYAEEMTDRIEIIAKEIEGQKFTGLRFYLELPCTVPYPKPGTGHTSGAASMEMKTVQAPFMHRPGDDDSAAVTFWGKRDMRGAMLNAIAVLDHHYAGAPQDITQAASNERADELGVVRISQAMRTKLTKKRLEGRSGWNADCTIEDLRQMLREHLAKGDMVDIANFAMMIWNREHPNG